MISRRWLSSRFNGVQSTGGVRGMGRVWTVPCWIPWMTSTKATVGLLLSGQGERQVVGVPGCVAVKPVTWS